MSLATRVEAIIHAAEEGAQHVKDAITEHLPEIADDPIVRAVERFADLNVSPAVRDAVAEFMNKIADALSDGQPAASPPAEPTEPPADPTGGGVPEPGAGPEPEPAQ
jgi:hypothetical protein